MTDIQTKTKMPRKTILGAAAEMGNFTTFLNAVEAADFVKTLEAEGPYTVFAPSDAAFAKLPKNMRTSMMKSSGKDRLQRILKNHVVEGRVMSKDVASVADLRMLGGEHVKIRKNGTQIQIGDAALKNSDLEADNGILHVIDVVLLPN